MYKDIKFMEKIMNINKSLDKAYEKKTLKEIADAPVDALEGVSEADCAPKLPAAQGME